MSPDDVPNEGIWRVSLRKVEVAVFTDAGFLLPEPLTLRCAALVLQHHPKLLSVQQANAQHGGRQRPRFHRMRRCWCVRQHIDRPDLWRAVVMLVA